MSEQPGKSEKGAVGEIVLMPLLFNSNGNLERGSKRTRVKIEPPIGKYAVYSHEVGSPPHSESYAYLMTPSGKLIHVGETRRMGEITEQRIDTYFAEAAALFEKQLADPAVWADYNAAAITNRIDEAEAHNKPVKEARQKEREKQAPARKAQNAATKNNSANQGNNPPAAITEEEINGYFRLGSGKQEGKERILDFFSRERSNLERTAFLKKEYHYWGGTWEYGGSRIGSHDSNPKGITLTKGETALNISWPEAAKRIAALIDGGNYMSETPRKPADFNGANVPEGASETIGAVRNGEFTTVAVVGQNDFAAPSQNDAEPEETEPPQAVSEPPEAEPRYTVEHLGDDYYTIRDNTATYVTAPHLEHHMRDEFATYEEAETLAKALNAGAVPGTPQPEPPKSSTRTSKPPSDSGLSDAGERLRGSRKERYALQREAILDALRESDLTDEEIKQMANRDAAWAKPDYRKMVESGLEPVLVYYIKHIRDKMPIRVAPIEGTPLNEAAVKYFEFLRELQEDIAASLKTSAEIPTYWVMFLLRNGYLEPKSNNQYNYTEKARGQICLAKAGSDLIWNANEVEARRIEAAVMNFPEHFVPAVRGLKFLVSKDENGQTVITAAKITKISGGSYAVNPVAQGRTIEEVREQLKRLAESKTPAPKTEYRKTSPVMRKSDVNTATFLKIFGFRSGEFGNYVTKAERQDFLNRAFDAFMDLSVFMGLQPRYISLGKPEKGIKPLAVSFGARGVNGKYAAFYVHAAKLLAFTKTKGGGALAHEWGHALDHFISDILGVSHEQISPLTGEGHGFEIPPEMPPVLADLAHAWHELYAALYFSNAATRQSTVYADNARLIDKRRAKPYWSTLTEMFARAFEACAEDTLKGENSFLVGNSRASRPYKDRKTKESRDVSIYPTDGAERAAINLQFMRLINALYAACDFKTLEQEKIEQLIAACKADASAQTSEPSGAEETTDIAVFPKEAMTASYAAPAPRAALKPKEAPKPAPKLPTELISELNAWLEDFDFFGAGCNVLDVFAQQGGSWTISRRSLIISESKRLTSYAVVTSIYKQFPRQTFEITQKRFLETKQNKDGRVNVSFAIGFKSSGGANITVMVTPSKLIDTDAANQWNPFRHAERLFGGKIGFSDWAKICADVYFRETRTNPNGENAMKPAKPEDFVKYKLLPRQKP
jgi:hypothetical protein